MRRPAAAQKNLDRIQAWRSVCPDITLRSTFIVGFPGETDSEFEELIEFIEEAQLDRVGCFQYSPVDGATANELPDPVAPEIAEERWHRFMTVQADISRNRLAQKVGKTMQVLIDGFDEQGRAVARCSADAPEIDGTVIIEPDDHLTVGEFATVTITGSDEYDLWAQLAID